MKGQSAAAKKPAILCIHTDMQLVTTLRSSFVGQYRFFSSPSQEGGIEIVMKENPQAVLALFSSLSSSHPPLIDALGIVRSIKQLNAALPVIMIAEKRDEIDEVVCLNCGADDFVHKSVHPNVLLARVSAILRCKKRDQQSSTIIESNGIRIDLEKYEAYVNGNPMQFTLTEFILFRAMVGSPNLVFSRARLLSKIKGNLQADWPGQRSVDVQVKNLRKKLGDLRGLIHTVRNSGYVFQPPSGE